MFSSAANLAARREVGKLELLQGHGHLRVMQVSRVSVQHRHAELLQCQSLGECGSGIRLSDVSIRLNREGLIEFWRRWNARPYMAAVEPVSRTAIPSEFLEVSRAVRCPRFCGRCALASRACPGLAGLRKRRFEPRSCCSCSWGNAAPQSCASNTTIPPILSRLTKGVMGVALYPDPLDAESHSAPATLFMQSIWMVLRRQDM